MKLSHKIVIINIVIVLVSIAVTSAFSLYSYRNDIRKRADVDLDARLKTFHELLKNEGAEVTVADGKLVAGSRVINGNFELPDKIKQLFGGTATIFMGDVRVSTNVVKPDGSRAVGTKLQGPAYDAVIRDGKPYRGAAPILEVPFFTAYDPIKNSSGQVIGVLYVGVRQDEYFASYDRLKYILIAMGAGLAIALSSALYLLVRRTMKPLADITESVGRLAEKDLSVSFDTDRRDEIGLLAQNMASMLQALKGVLSRLNEASGNVMSTSVGLNSAASGISESAGTAAAQAITVATAGEEMAATSQDIAGNCHLVAQSAQRAAQLTENGFAVVQRTVLGIRERGEQTKLNALAISKLGDRSQQIGEIVSTIEDIADQTNLLALNAAIEAARAGEQGRGFAVVADEVRALAERTTKATKEITDMIKAIQSETGAAIVSMEAGVSATAQGAEEAAHLEDSLREVLEQVNAVTVQTSQIATAAEQQTATTSEIASNIMRITEAAQLSSSKAQDTAIEAGKLNRLAEQLVKIQSEFKQG